jgi:hypothetical protein
MYEKSHDNNYSLIPFPFRPNKLQMDINITKSSLVTNTFILVSRRLFPHHHTQKKKKKKNEIKKISTWIRPRKDIPVVIKQLEKYVNKQKRKVLEFKSTTES